MGEQSKGTTPSILLATYMWQELSTVGSFGITSVAASLGSITAMAAVGEEEPRNDLLNNVCFDGMPQWSSNGRSQDSSREALTVRSHCLQSVQNSSSVWAKVATTGSMEGDEKMLGGVRGSDTFCYGLLALQKNSEQMAAVESLEQEQLGEVGFEGH